MQVWNLTIKWNFFVKLKLKMCVKMCSIYYYYYYTILILEKSLSQNKFGSFKKFSTNYSLTNINVLQTWQLSRPPSLYPAQRNTSWMVSRRPAARNHLWHLSFGITSTCTSCNTVGTVATPTFKKISFKYNM